jgi:hypothetical protein
MPVTLAQLERKAKHWFRIAMVIQVIHLVGFMAIFPRLPDHSPTRSGPNDKLALVILEIVALVLFAFLYWNGHRGEKLKLNWPVKPGRENATRKVATWLVSQVLTYIAVLFFAIFLMVSLESMGVIGAISPLWVIVLIIGNLFIIMRGLMMIQDANAGRIS